MYSFGIRGKQFQFIEGQLPKSVRSHGRLIDHDVRQIQDAGGKVSIVDAHYTDKELEDARKSCGASSSDAPSPPAPPAAVAAPKPETKPQPAPAGDAVKAESTPSASSNSRALGKSDLVDLLKGEIPSARVTQLVKERNIKFTPTEDDYKEIRAAGGEDDLINVLKAEALLRQ